VKSTVAGDEPLSVRKSRGRRPGGAAETALRHDLSSIVGEICSPGDFCEYDEDCDDGDWCNGQEVCVCFDDPTPENAYGEGGDDEGDDEDGDECVCWPGTPPCEEGLICDPDQETCVNPEADLDIKAFRAPKRLKLPPAPGPEIGANGRTPRFGRFLRVKMRQLALAVENESPAMGGAMARLESTNEAGLTVVQERVVQDRHGGRFALYFFRFPRELGPGMIRHKVVLTDADPDTDAATAVTMVLP